MAQLNEAKPIRALDLTTEEKADIAQLCFITAKRAMYVGNVADDGFTNNPLLDRLTEFATKRNAPVVAICAAIESEIVDLDDADRQAFLSDMGMEEPGLNRLIRAAFKLLGLQTYFTAGVKEVRAWTVPIGATAPGRGRDPPTSNAASSAHRPSPMNYIAYKGEQGAKEAGKMRAEGKEYIVQDGDVMNFLFNV